MQLRLHPDDVKLVKAELQSVMTPWLQQVCDLQGAVNSLRTQLQQERALPLGKLASDHVEIMTAGAGVRVVHDLPKEFGRIAVRVKVLADGGNGLGVNAGVLGINQENGITIVNQDDFPDMRIGRLVLDNTLGNTTMSLLVFFAVGVAGATTMRPVALK